MNKPTPQSVSSAGNDRSATTARRRLTSAELLGQGREVIIEHADGEYRLRLTSQGKLILTK